MQRVLCIWLPNWPIQRQVVEQPQLKRTRLILWHRDSRRGQLVSAASPLAKRAGVRIGMPLSEAETLLTKSALVTTAAPRETSPHLAPESQQQTEPWKPQEPLSSRQHPRQQSKTLARKLNELNKRPTNNSQPPCPAPPTEKSSHTFAADLPADQRALKQLADSCQTLAPIVGLETSDCPSCIFLDVTNLAPLYKTEARLIQKVTEHFRQAGYLIRPAIADTLSVAWALAHYAQDSPAIAPSHSGLEPLEWLPIQSLRISPTTCDTLKRLGIDTVQQLLQLPRVSLTARFGDEINRRLDQATGTVKEVFEVIHTPAEYSAEEILEWPVKDTTTTMVIVQRLIEKVCQQLTGDARGALQWTIRLTRQQASPIRLEIKLFQPTTTAEHVMQLAEMQLDNHPELRPLSSRKRKHLSRQSPVTEVRIGVTHCVQLAERQRKLFDEDPSLNRTALAQLINRLSSRLGQEQVTRPVLQSGAQPEFSFRLKPLVDPSKRQAKTRQKKSHYVMARPLRLLQPAIPLLPCPASQSLPATFQKPDRSVIRIRRNWGPERIETGWWRGETVCRDYWRIETERGDQLWVYRDRRAGKWFLHGEF